MCSVMYHTCSTCDVVRYRYVNTTQVYGCKIYGCHKNYNMLSHSWDDLGALILKQFGFISTLIVVEIPGALIHT